MRVSRKLSGLLGAMLVGACGAEVSAPPLQAPDAGPSPLCPSGPNGPRAALTNLPSGACQGSNGSCNYQGTPCPSVKNGTVNGYTCDCTSGTWSCEIVNQSGGFCSPLPDGGYTEDASWLLLDAAPDDAGPSGYTGPSGPTGPSQP